MSSGLLIAFGPMFSGKTTWLTLKLSTCADVGLKVCLVNHEDDVRLTESSDGNITTHSSQFKYLSPKITAMKLKSLRDESFDEYDVIGIDEGQFFDNKLPNGIPEIVHVVRELILKKEKIVFISSLDGDFRAQPFGYVKELICLCDPDGVVKLSALCMECLKERKLVKAGFTNKIVTTMTDPDKVKDVGGADKYQALCLDCFRTKNVVTTKKREDEDLSSVLKKKYDEDLSSTVAKLVL